jgi:iron complex outermembrane receptor protein
VSGFYEFFKNEFVTQSPGVGLLSYTFNAPKSEHRGIEVVADWQPVEGPLEGLAATLSYTFNDQIYTTYFERLSGANTDINRANNHIPGVEPHNISARLAYDQPSGPLQGLGGFVEMNFRDTFYVDNANTVKAPDYTLFNLNIHYSRDVVNSYVKGYRVFVEVQNLMDRTYVASANNVSNTLNGTAATVLAATGSVYAGSPRNIVGGLKVKF